MLWTVWWRNVQLFGRVFESLPLVTEPNTNYFAIKVQLVSKLRHLGTYRHVHTDISAENGKSAHMHRQISTDQSQSMLLFNCQILYLSTYIGRQYMQKNIYTCKWTEIGRQLNPFSLTLIGHYMMTSFTLLHFTWNRANHCGGTCSQLMPQVGGGKTGNRLRWSIPL